MIPSVMPYSQTPPADLRALAITRSYLEEVAKHFPNDPRLQEYEELSNAIARTRISTFVTITTSTPITDLVDFENYLVQIQHQITREILGHRKNSKLPIIVVIETNKTNNTIHAHVLIGEVIGERRSRADTTFKSYLKKQTLPTILRVLNRVTKATAPNKIIKAGRYYIAPVSESKGELIDYLLKQMKTHSLNVAWSATQLDFKKEVKIVQRQSSKKKHNSYLVC